MKLLSTLLLFFTVTAHASGPELPRLFFSYSWLYDSVVCANKPDVAWMDEVENRTISFSKLWETRGPEYFKVLFDRTGLGFSRKELSATFSVCPKKPSFSDPLVLNMTGYLSSYMNPMATLSDDEFVSLVFHELLHTWVMEHLERSAMRFKYKDELPSVKSHMHLMAIQKYVYTTLNRPDLITLLDETHARLGGVYTRAWEIVKIEGVEAFMNEFPTVKEP